MKPSMITIGLYYDMIPGKGADFEGKFFAVLEAMEGVPGHKESFLYQRVDDRDSDRYQVSACQSLSSHAP